MKKVISLLLTVCLSCLLVMGCGNTQPAENSDKAEETVTAAEDNAATQEEMKEETVEESEKEEAVENKEENEEENGTGDESSLFSCVGKWSDENGANIFDLKEDGTGSLTQVGTVNDGNSVQTSSNVTWEDKGETVTITSDLYGPYDFMKVKDGDRDTIRTEKVVYYRMEETTEDETATEEQPDESGSSDEEVSAEEIDAALQGTWSLNGGSFYFEDGSVNLASNGQTLSGTYEIKTEESVIDAHFEANNGTVSIHMPYTYSDGEFVLLNNHGEELVKE